MRIGGGTEQKDRTMATISQTNGNGQGHSFKVRVNRKQLKPYREPIVFLEDRVRTDPCPQENYGVHDWMLGHTLTGISADLTFEQVYGIIQKYTNRTDDNPRYRTAYKGGQRTCRLEILEIWEEYEHKIPRTLAPRRSDQPYDASAHIQHTSPLGVPLPPYTPRHIERWEIVSTDPSRVLWNFKDNAMLSLESQAQLYLSSRFSPHEDVPIKYIRESKAKVRKRDEWIENVHWLIKPDGREGVWTTANTALSAREEHVLRWNSVVCEDDNSPPEKQWEVYRNSGLPIHTITWSAGKSLHAIVDIGDCKDGSEYRGKAEAVYRWLENKGLKMDWGCRNPNRLTRVGGAIRNGKTQTLLLSGWHGGIEWRKADKSTDQKTDHE